jgi:hypothetical protein
MPVTVAEGVVEVTADAKGVPEKIARDIESGTDKAEKAGRSVGKGVFGGLMARGAPSASAPRSPDGSRAASARPRTSTKR